MAGVDEMQADMNRIADKVWRDSPEITYREAMIYAEQTVKSWGDY